MNKATETIIIFNEFYHAFFSQEDFDADAAGALLNISRDENLKKEFVSWLDMGIGIVDVAYGFDLIPLTTSINLDSEEMEEYWYNSDEYEVYQGKWN